jgi:peptidoglycan/LPS O-acetylase OafA/YrhL
MKNLQETRKKSLGPTAIPGRIVATQLLSLPLPSALIPDERVVRVPDKGFYQPELDSLRFMAFLSVFFYHCIPSEPSFYKGWPHAIVSFIGAAVTAGAFGVQVFFVLSAYLITNLLLREKERTGRLDIRSFYVRRILRIWPLYYAFLAVVSLLPFIVHYQRMPLVYIAGYSLLIGNWVQAFAAYSQSTLMARPLWSVSIEEQFYLLWPLVVRKASRASIAGIAIALLIAANLSRVLLAFSTVSSRFNVIDLNTVSNMDPIALGVLLALGLKQPPALSLLKRVALFLACVFVMIGVGGFVEVHKVIGAIVGKPLAAFASAGILVCFLGVRNYAICNSLVQYFGKISYGLYVIHMSALICVAHVLKESASRYETIGGRIEIAAPALAITIAGAWISYKWLETPFLRLKERFTHIHSRPV